MGALSKVAMINARTKLELDDKVMAGTIICVRLSLKLLRNL